MDRAQLSAHVASLRRKGIIALMRNRWVDSTGDEMQQLVHQSRLVGQEESLVLWGGGNNSVKSRAADLLGQPLDVMFIKSSGSDMKTITARQFPAVRLDYIRPLRQRTGEMSDQEMVDYLLRCLLDPAGPRPSIETLLHAFLPAPAVLHTHADAILALTNNRGRETTVQECFGDSVLRVAYRRPGFQLSLDVASAFDSAPYAEGLILMNHGLITWGATSREAYDRHIALVSRAEEFLASRRGRPAARTPRDRAASESASSIAPALRGALSAQRSVILELDDSDEVLAFLECEDLDRIVQRGAATPDHLLHTKRFPLLIRSKDELQPALQWYLEREAAVYAAHPMDFAMLDPNPRVVLMPGVGMWTAGKDARAARIVRDIYRHTMSVIGDAEAVGRYDTLSDEDAFHAEYWPLELFKLTLLPKERELAGKVVLVTGAASGIGRAIAERFAEEGCGSSRARFWVMTHSLRSD